MHRKAGWLAVCLAVRLVWLAELTISSSRFVSSHPTYLSTSSQPVPFRSSVPRSESVAGTYTHARTYGYLALQGTRDKDKGQGTRGVEHVDKATPQPGERGWEGAGGWLWLVADDMAQLHSCLSILFYFILFYPFCAFPRQTEAGQRIHMRIHTLHRRTALHGVSPYVERVFERGSWRPHGRRGGAGRGGAETAIGPPPPVAGDGRHRHATPTSLDI